uniref:ATP-dependent RNA helicase SUV3 C-terminal domain-containing protein n=1 Tax=Davidia involucrata TaxID=16924 RepID=A0A5B7AUJ6_DAVIN
MGMPKCSARNDTELLDLETKHHVLSMYLWLSYHFKEETFPYVKKAEAMATDIADLLGESLTKACWKPESRHERKLFRQLFQLKDLEDADVESIFSLDDEPS